MQLHFDQLLVCFGERLQCQKRYFEEGKKLADMVFSTLQKYSQCNIASFHIGGSFGKKTDVIEPDLDMVVLVNDCHPPLEGVLNDFEQILRDNEDLLQIHPGVYKKTELSLHFSFTNGIEVDLLPAAKIQTKHGMQNVIQEMRCHHKFAYFYNPSFVEHQIKFLESQDSFTHTLVRLSKFWFKSLYLGESFRGGSAIIELIAVAAAEIEQEGSDKSASRAFKRVLDSIINLRSTKLAFCHYKCERNLEKWRRVSPDDLKNINKHNGLVPQIVGKYEILQRRYFIIDPANPFQDYLEDKTDSVMRTLCEFAKSTRRRLEMILNGHGIYGQNIYELFKPLPDILTTNVSTVSLPRNVLITHNEFCMSVHNQVNIRNEYFRKQTETRRAVKILKNNLLTIVHATVDGKPGKVSVNDVNNAVLKLIGNNNSKLRIKNTTDPNDHNWQYDATVKVPYVINGTSYAVCVSMTWSPDFPDLSEQTSERRGSGKMTFGDLLALLLVGFIIWLMFFNKV